MDAAKLINAITQAGALVLVGLAALFGMTMYARGKAIGKANADLRIEREQRRAAEAARHIRTSVRGLSARDVDERLRNEGWLR